MAHNCHIKTKCSQQIKNRSHQIQIAHIKFKSLTANSNRSQQIQIAHSKLQIAHSKLQIARIKFKSLTSNSNRSQQIQIAHSKFKLLTSNYKSLTPLGVFGYLQPAGCNLSKNIYHTWSRYSLKFACVNLRDSCGPPMDCVMPLSLCFNQNVFQGFSSLQYDMSGGSV